MFGRQGPKFETSCKKLSQEVTEMRQAIASVEAACLDVAAVAHQENWGNEWTALKQCAAWARQIVESLLVWESNDSAWDDNQFRLAQALDKDKQSDQSWIGFLTNGNFVRVKFEELRDATIRRVKEILRGSESDLPRWLRDDCRYEDIEEPWDFVGELRDMQVTDARASESQVRISEELYDAVSSYAAVVSCIGAFRQLATKFEKFQEKSKEALDEVYGFRRERNEELVHVHDEVMNLKQRWEESGRQSSDELKQEVAKYRNKVVLMRDRAVLDEIDPPPGPPQEDTITIADRIIDATIRNKKRLSVLWTIMSEVTKCLAYIKAFC